MTPLLDLSCLPIGHILRTRANENRISDEISENTESMCGMMGMPCACRAPRSGGNSGAACALLSLVSYQAALPIPGLPPPVIAFARRALRHAASRITRLERALGRLTAEKAKKKTQCAVDRQLQGYPIMSALSRRRDQLACAGSWWPPLHLSIPFRVAFCYCARAVKLDIAVRRGAPPATQQQTEPRCNPHVSVMAAPRLREMTW